MHRLLFRVGIALQGSVFVPRSWRVHALRRLGIKCSSSARVYEQVFFGSNKIQIGPRSFISLSCLLDGSDQISIGADVHLAPGVTILTSSHEEGPSSRRAGEIRRAAVSIEDGCWIGANVTILPGVKIAKGCIVGAGAVVHRDTEPNGSYAGVPAVRKRDLS